MVGHILNGDLKFISAGFLGLVFGSLWIWMYYFSLLAFKESNVLVNWLRWFLDIDEQPIRSVGVVTAGISTIAYGLVLLVFQLLGR
jgi:hypothetical protein